MLAAPFAILANQQHQHMSKYAGQEQRDIKAFSSADLAELRRGGGWGLAKAAELNGVPGPAHVLELKDAIALSADQVAATEALFERMRASAIEKGERLIELEAELERRFQEGAVTSEKLRELLERIGSALAALRYVHLSAHLEMINIMSTEQIAAYNRLRGYGAGDACDSVPEGRDAVMWRKHHGCD